MKDQRNVKRSFTARYRQVFKKAAGIAAMIDGKTPEEFNDGDMVDLRDAGNDLLQCIHEVNAYRNVLKG
jgi:hypothetical protein